ncbi:hypothetical protein KVR01_009118 [Diaporthe batatas]|uniref:uncharacterized protein n=1 Tax=Diaporthe batatas TaxID=748121 RepID=UPI001D04864A|nr:uncharacterized protein KVR01_009118 [Diaporthe batatas]KAG8160854.1 hypothetical protein KVR01_009118 [Diaporthe batatas]
MPSVPSYHVLDFFHDDEDGCALTITRNYIRFHIIADPKRLKRECDRKQGREYFGLLQNLRDSERREDGSTSIDSGIDVQSSHADDSKIKKAGMTCGDAEERLHKWMLAPLAARLQDLAPDLPPTKQQTLQQWYDCKTHFFNLEIAEQGVEAAELTSSEDLEERMTKLRPHLAPIPKYISNIDMPWYSSASLEVIASADTPSPYHPCLVAHAQSGEKMFFKTVDNNNTQPIKREIDILAKIERKGLRKILHCPKLLGIVTCDTPIVSGKNNRSSIMGFLQTAIDEPIPLTTKLDSAVPQDKRDAWARKADDARKILHENGIIWGDAKADNFMVDAKDNLWIIDFGGSYTEGWVDPDIAETKEGDNMGVEKIVNALRDPDHNVAVSETSDDDEDEDNRVEATSSRIRKRVNGFHHMRDRKRHKASSAEKVGEEKEGEEENRYCYRGGASSGQMIGCDGSDCEMEWFHVSCTDITALPPKEEAWYCEACKV